MPPAAPRQNHRLASGSAAWARSELQSSPFSTRPPGSLPRNVAKGAQVAAAPATLREPVAPEEAGPFIRLRTVLVLAMLGLAAWVLHPRAEAAWKLHSTAAQLANYGLCMVGPTGPALLRDNSPEFSALVRRRLIGAEAGERPFQDCASIVRELTQSASAERAHRLQAWSFTEYGGSGPTEASLADLGVTGHHLSSLARRAWPFVRGGYVKLVKPSLSQHEAVHPVETAKPGVGRGLPAWRAGYRAVGEVGGVLTAAFGHGATLNVHQSADGGLSWRPAPARGTEAFAERCPAGPRWYTFALSEDAASLMAVSHAADAPPHPSTLGPADTELVAVTCDQKALVVAHRTEADKLVRLTVCGHRGRCSSMPLPQFAGVGGTPGAALDLARVDGTTVLSVPMNGIVRVTSTRDDGQTWTPFTVAYDDAAHSEPRVDARVPTRLLAVGKRVMLYGAAAKPGQTYSVLSSDDLGASWRTPDGVPAAVAVNK
ncbi:MAG: hypothetical protein IT377_25730 [Polyangiaceae bacterium]|nr:hypothetical protein [Polyangiaceae bacterium]